MSDTPEQIGPYQVVHEVGRGGMGVVYLGNDPRLDRRVAIKAIAQSNSADAEQRTSRFERESRILAQLQHPNIAGIYGLEEADQHTYLILEYVEGATLTELVRDSSIPTLRVLEIMSQVARGMAAAHDAGVIHRDLKPGNIMVTNSGQAKILDFGLAREMNASRTGSVLESAPTCSNMTPETAYGTVLGTPAYMSPEQARGEITDARTDVWSFAVILYELLVGTPLFQRASVGATLAAVLHETIDFDAVSNSSPMPVRHLLRRCLERDPAQRWNSMTDVRIELEDTRPDREETVLSRRGLAEGVFQLGDDVCRKMNRTDLDPLTLGWLMQYGDNQNESPDLLLWVPSFGGDHSTLTYRTLLEACPYRMVMLTPLGLEPNITVRPRVSLENQCVAIRELAMHLRALHRPRRFVLGGSSCGGTMALNAAVASDTHGVFDGLLLVDPAITRLDCFVTSLFADLQLDSEASIVDAVRELGRACESVDDWLALHEYMVQCVGKMKNDMTPLVLQAQQLTEPFADVSKGADSPFTQWLRHALDNVDRVCCYFPNAPEKQAPIGQIRFRHFEDNALGDRFADDTFVITDTSSHREILRPENILKCINAFIDDMPE